MDNGKELVDETTEVLNSKRSEVLAMALGVQIKTGEDPPTGEIQISGYNKRNKKIEETNRFVKHKMQEFSKSESEVNARLLKIAGQPEVAEKIDAMNQSKRNERNKFRTEKPDNRIQDRNFRNGRHKDVERRRNEHRRMEYNRPDRDSRRRYENDRNRKDFRRRSPRRSRSRKRSRSRGRSRRSKSKERRNRNRSRSASTESRKKKHSSGDREKDADKKPETDAEKFKRRAERILLLKKKMELELLEMKKKKEEEEKQVICRMAYGIAFLMF